jgi:hypothetical protein
MTQPVDVLVAEALSTGRISHLPDGHFIDGRFQPFQYAARMDSWDPGRGGRRVCELGCRRGGRRHRAG